MRNTLTLLLLCLLVGTFSIDAKKLPKENFVEITLKTGDVVTGYIYSGWNRNYIRKTQNYKFSIVPQQNDGKKQQIWYTADDVLSVVYTKSDPQYRWESHNVYHKAFSDDKALRRHMVCIEVDGDDVAICWWNQLNGINRFGAVDDILMYGLVVRNEDIVLPILRGSGKKATPLSGLIEHHLKESQPEFVEAYTKYLEDKQNCKDFIDNPAVVIDIFRKYWKKAE